MKIFGFGEKKILDCTCGCGCRETFEEFGMITKGKEEYSARRYGTIWTGDYTICKDCNYYKHSKSKWSSSSKRINQINQDENSIKFEEFKGVVKGISDEEFEILLKLGFSAKGFEIYQIRRKVILSNDYVLSLKLKSKENKNLHMFVAHVDRIPNEYSLRWMDDFLVRANEYQSYFGESSEIFVMNINENMTRYETPKKSDTRHNRDKVKLLVGKKFHNFFKKLTIEKKQRLEKLFSNENKIWDQKSQDEQREFCEKVNVNYVQYNRLWKYPIYDQCKLIYSLDNSNKEHHEESSKNNYDDKYNTNENTSDYGTEEEFTLKDAYEILDVDESSTFEEIKVSKKKLILMWHPDKHRNESRKKVAEKEIKKINIAFDILESERNSK